MGRSTVLAIDGTTHIGEVKALILTRDSGTALGIEPETASTAVRISMGRFTTKEEVYQASQVLRSAIKTLKSEHKDMVTLKFGKANSVVGFSTLKTSRFNDLPPARIVRELVQNSPADLRRGPAPPCPGLRRPGDPGVHPPGPQAQNRMALGVKGGGMWGQWYTLSPPPPVGAMPKPRLTRSEGPPTPSPG